MRRSIAALLGAGLLVAGTATGAQAATPKPTVDSAVASVMTGRVKPETAVAKLPKAQQLQALNKIADQLDAEVSSIKVDMTPLNKLVKDKKVLASSRRWCDDKGVEGYKEKLGIEFHLELWVRACGRGNSLITSMKVLRSDLYTNIPGVSTHHRNDSTRIIDGGAHARGVARWTIGVTWHGIGIYRSVCPQLQVGWHAPLRIGYVLVEQFWHDKCTLN